MKTLTRLSRAEEAVAEATRTLRAAEAVLADLKEANPTSQVGKSYRVAYARALRPVLIATARNSAEWLAEKCITAGPGAATDSDEAKIVILIEELCERLETECPQ